MMRHFSLTAWGPHNGDFTLLRADADWCHAFKPFGEDVTMPGWFCVTVGLLGFCVCITFWPGGVP